MSLKAWGVSGPLDLSGLMDFIIEYADTSDILDYIGRKEVMREIDVDDFVRYKGEDEILDCIDVKEAMDHYDLIQKSEGAE